MKILLVCNAGMSTGIMQLKLEEHASANNMVATVEALPISEIENNLEGVDVILLGPQVRFAEKDIKKMVDDEIPVFSIDIQDFGLMRADRVWGQINKELDARK